MDSIERHQDAADLDRALTLAWTHAQVQLRHLDIRPTQADLFQKLAGFLLYAGPTLRASPEQIRRGAGPPVFVTVTVAYTCHAGKWHPLKTLSSAWRLYLLTDRARRIFFPCLKAMDSA